MKKLNFKAPEWLSNAFRSRPLQYITFIGIITGLVYFIGRQAGRESFGDYKPKKLPEDPDWTPDLLVSQIWDVLDGWFTLASDKEEVFIALMALSNRQLTEVYNTYNSRYGKKDGKTLTAKINDETNVFWTGEKKNVVNKLRKLNLN